MGAGQVLPRLPTETVTYPPVHSTYGAAGQRLRLLGGPQGGLEAGGLGIAGWVGNTVQDRLGDGTGCWEEDTGRPGCCWAQCPPRKVPGWAREPGGGSSGRASAPQLGAPPGPHSQEQGGPGNYPSLTSSVSPSLPPQLLLATDSLPPPAPPFCKTSSRPTPPSPACLIHTCGPCHPPPIPKPPQTSRTTPARGSHRGFLTVCAQAESRSPRTAAHSTQKPAPQAPPQGSSARTQPPSRFRGP